MQNFLAGTMIAAAVLMGSSALAPSNAASKVLPHGGHMSGHHMSGHNMSGGSFFRHRGHHRDRDFGVFFGAPFVGSYAYQDDGHSCGWLHRRAVRTGSSYWWDRYEACVGY